MRPLLYVCRRVRVFMGERERVSERERVPPLCVCERERERVGVSVLSTLRLSLEVRMSVPSTLCESGR